MSGSVGLAVNTSLTQYFTVHLSLITLIIANTKPMTYFNIPLQNIESLRPIVVDNIIMAHKLTTTLNEIFICNVIEIDNNIIYLSQSDLQLQIQIEFINNLN